MSIILKKEHGKPLYMSLYEAISHEIYTGHMRPGARLTPRRELARELNISENTVDGAYKMLVDTGYVKSIPRQGYIVSFKGIVTGDKPWEQDAPETVVFSPNGIDISRINRSVYAKLLRDIAYNEGKAIFSYPEKGGEFELRNAVAKYLYSFRDIKCSPEQIIIGAGAEYMILAIAAVLDCAKFIMENPCDTHFYRALEDNNAAVSTLPVNIGSFDFEALYKARGNVLFIEPDARFPRGMAMNEDERARLLVWAEEKNGYIIENAIDSELYHMRRKPLFSADMSGRVVYLGSFSHSFCPAVKTSYMVLPQELMEKWKKRHTYYYALTSVAEQLALAEYVEKGYFTKHSRSMRQLYHEKKLFAAEQLTVAEGIGLKTELSEGSTYLTAECRGYDAERLKLAGRRCGVKLFSMNSYNVHKTTEPVFNDRLVIGCGELSREAIKTGIRLLSNNIE